MRITKLVRTMALLIAVAFSINCWSAGQIYRWIDDDGVVHFGKIVPDGVEAQAVGVRPNTVPIERKAPKAAEIPAGQAPQDGEEPQLSYAEQRRQDRREQRSANREAQREIEANCAVMRAQKEFLEPSPRVLIQDEDGGVRRLDNAERERGLAEANAYLAKNCNN